MSTVPKHYITPEEYLHREKKAEFRSEYFRGEMFAKAGASANHNLIVLNAGSHLREQLKKKPCRVYPSNLKLRIESTGLCQQNVPVLSSPEAIKAGATQLLHAYAVRVGIKIMDRLQDFCKQNHKELMVLLSYPVGAVWHACNRSSSDDPDNTDWHPQYFKDHLAERGIRMVDSLPAHVTEFDSFRLSAKEYVDRYYIGHYTPRGNHFFAYANKDAIRNWLNPPPPAYQNNQEPLIRFKGYLPG